jgi:D-alanyl-D-alanine carboxypeptidase
MHIESSNDAAMALSENIEKKSGQKFVDLMNEKANNMGLKDTSFADPSGLNPSNFSSAWELVKIMAEVLKQPTLIQIMQTKQMAITSQEGNKHILNSTNKLLGKIPQIIAAKTGYTEEAGNCMATAFKAPDNESTITVIVMDTPDRMAETSNLIKWTSKAYSW